MYRVCIGKKGSYTKTELFFDTVEEVDTLIHAMLCGKNADDLEVTLTFEKVAEEW